MNPQIVFKFLSEGYSQIETADKLKVSLSALEKFIKAQKKYHNAKSIFHLAIILKTKKVI